MLLALGGYSCSMASHHPNAGNPPIPVQFTLKEAGYVSLVIEKSDGVRVRNLVSDTWFPAGTNVVYWNGLDDLGQDADAASHGVYRIPAHFVDPGNYKIRGVFHKAIVPRYKMSVYSTGNPPWDLPTHTGGWLANHTPPQAALYVPANQSPTGRPAVYLGCYVTEGLDGLAWVDLDGNKLGGKRWIGGNWTSAPFIARDASATADPAIFAYVASAWRTSDNKLGSNEIRITGLTKGPDKAIFYQKLDTVANKVDFSFEIGGLAVNNNVGVLSLSNRNKIIFIDLKTGQIIGNTMVNTPKGLAFDAQGRLLVLSDTKLLRYNIHNLNNISNADEIINSGLEAPYAITTDPQGNLYISDRGNSNQVKVFNGAGKFLTSIGKPGPIKAGLYDQMHMNNPAGLTIDSKNQLWVAETDFMPKRVSVWSLDGKLINAFYGPPKYGGGGTLDSRDQNTFFYSGDGGSMEFSLDWQKGTSQLKRVFYRPSPTDLKMTDRSSAPETPIYFNGKRYFTNCFNSEATNGPSTAFLFLDANGIAVPVAAAGIAQSWNTLKDPKFNSNWPVGVHANSTKPEDKCYFIWTDNNYDGQIEPNEVTITKSVAHGITIEPDLSFCFAGIGDQTIRFAPGHFTPAGVPQYDVTKGEVLASGILPPASTGGDQVLVGNNGYTVVTNGVKSYGPLAISGFKNGTEVWTYPDMWPGLHASHSAPIPSFRGELVGTTRLLGGFFTIKGSDAGQCWAVNGNQGTVYLFTADGLFITTLFLDSRQSKRWTMPQAIKNMKLDSITLHEEDFYPTITKTANDSIYMVDGNRSSLISFDGLESLQRLPDFNITVSKNDLVKANDYFLQTEADRQVALSENSLTIALSNKAPVIDGKLDDWAGAQWATIDKSGVNANFNSKSKPYNITGAIKIAGANLYLAYQTGIKNLANSGESPNAPFITGQALDLMIGTDPAAPDNRLKPVEGDLRLVITVLNNKPWAVLYRAVVKGVSPDSRIPFSSPSRTITFDKVEDVSSQIQFATDNGNYEVAIPLNVLGLKPKDGMLIKGDIGVLQGISGSTTSRSYWSNKSAGINADVPSEAELDPILWGTWLIKAE